ncbi:MAG: 30S ribosomal protein S30e [Candidatus Heimdallarchaeum aukensis]|uniref:30S ribosomal protein S30e n=2 Tax=Candidatus Heimdallarchaeum TaxID=3053649 RepID=A0A9Y1BVH3_9ARCH|nr:MAG: 30S ribosomal protein S30e [Candidatus Heimdallarchaeum aukensis]UJG44749.1 MAG: 30S ribosomal protein S30e [Candidatus Heimdallarchaeum endolithica]
MGHGSLQKAGKVRKQTPKVQGKERVSPIPRLGHRNNYIRRVIKGKFPGQPTSMGSRRHNM